MSGGAFNYLGNIYNPVDYFSRKSDLKEMQECLIKNDYIDIAKDTQRLIEYINCALVRIEVLSEKLKPVFHAVEWYESGDSGEDDLKQAIEKYRCENYKNKKAGE